MDREEGADMVVRQHKIEWWVWHELMFVTDVLLLSGAWGMSCYAVKHYTQQPTQLFLPTVPLSFSLPFFASPNLPYNTFVPFDHCPLFACLLSLTQILNTPVPWQMGFLCVCSAFGLKQKIQESRHFIFRAHKPIWGAVKENRHHRKVECLVLSQNKHTKHLRVFTGVLSGSIVTLTVKRQGNRELTQSSETWAEKCWISEQCS